jgi:hypothetical protein
MSVWTSLCYDGETEQRGAGNTNEMFLGKIPGKWLLKEKEADVVYEYVDLIKLYSEKWDQLALCPVRLLLTLIS